VIARALVAALLSFPALAQVSESTFFTGEYLGDTHVVLSVLSAKPGMRGWKTTEGNTLHRVFFDGARQPAFGYDLSITPDPKAKTFRVTVLRPRSTFRMRYPPDRPGLPMEDRVVDGRKLASFSKLPAPVTVSDGDRLDIPVFENAKTGDRVLDSYSIAFRGTTATRIPYHSDFPKYLSADALLSLERPHLETNISELGENRLMGVTGPVVWLYSRWLGRVLFSASPRPGFRRQAVATGPKVRFHEGAEEYRLDLAANVIGGPGSWWIWVKREPAFKPPPGPWTADELHKGMLALGIER
jgi:hypothetical protein